MAIASVDSRVQKYKNLYADSMNKDIAAINKTAESQKKVINDTYNKSINDTKSSYNEQQQLNEIQKYVNERAIAENMANGGLQNSGLNDTQRTAVQLSYANNKAKIDRALSSAVENFRLEMNSKLTDVENTRISNESTIRQNYDKAALSAAQEEYQTEYDANTELQKAYISAMSKNSNATSNLINTSGSLINRSAVNGNLENSGIQVTVKGNYNSKAHRYEDGATITYLDTVTGKKTTLAANQSPFVSGSAGVNKDTTYGVFSNGYQPDNVNGKKLSHAKTNTNKNATITFNGQEQSVWQIGKKYYVWNGSTNKYQEFTKDELKQFVDLK